jgi:diguanylate cyclase (GGDEF)-like protein
VLPSPDWSAQQLAEFLAVVSASRDEESAIEVAVERAAEAVEAEIGAMVCDDALVFAIGFPTGQAPEQALRDAVTSGAAELEVDGLGACPVLVVPVDDESRLVLARAGEGFTREEANMARGMGRVLSLTLRMLRVLGAERALRQESQRQEEELRERQTLIEQLFEIQRLISGRAPTQVVFDAIVKSAATLFGDEVVGLRLIDAREPDVANLVASVGVSEETLAVARRSPVGEGVGGRAIAEGRLVATDDYASFPHSLPVFAGALGSAMAAPVARDGVVVGSLTIACHRRDRAYSERERGMLRALAEHVSLALNDESARNAIDKALGDAVYQATHDPLSGLPNRALVVDRLEHALARSHRGTRELGVLFIDLDRFKQVNDSLGHGIGDEVLVEVAQRLAAGVRPGDTVGRLAGDEFVVVCEDVSLEETVLLAERLAAEVASPMNLYGRETVLTASIGVAHTDSDGHADEMLRNADVAMYRAKERGRARIEVFDSAMRTRVLQRIETEQALRRAIRKGELRVHYQPIYSLTSNRLVSVEALVRWQHSDGTLVLPDEFIPLAEDTGLIIPLGEWVLRTACTDVARWRATTPALRDIGLTVNLSGRQFADSGLAAVIAGALELSGLDERMLALEITESVLMDEADSTVNTLTALKRLGVSVVVDDFGTGYSSLSYLRRFPVDALKIDRSFVSALQPTDAEDAIVTAVLGLARALGLRVVAEGIETSSQLDALRKWGCDYGQGFLLGRPMSADQLLVRLGARVAPRMQPVAAADAVVDGHDRDGHDRDGDDARLLRIHAPR